MDALVLLGPNGVGKSTVGRALAATGHFRFLDLEGFFVQQYGTIDAYRANRETAYARFEALVRSAIATGGGPVVFEEVGLNENARRMIDALRRDHDVVFVELRASRDVCLRRAERREGGDRFSKTPDSVSAVWERFTTDAAPTQAIAHTIDTERQDVAAIVVALLPLAAR